MSLVDLSLICIISISISILSFAITLFLDPGLVEADDTLLKLFVVSDVLNNLEDVSRELFLLQILHVKLVT